MSDTTTIQTRADVMLENMRQAIGIVISLPDGPHVFHRQLVGRSRAAGPTPGPCHKRFPLRTPHSPWPQAAPPATSAPYIVSRRECCWAALWTFSTRLTLKAGRNPIAV
jgi:hypothetical protein